MGHRLLIWAVAAALGLSALLRVSRVGYDILRLAGAAYRSGSGPAACGGCAAVAPLPPCRTGPGRAGPPAGRAGAYLNGLLSNLFNPKIGVFFVAFLPGFIPAKSSAATFSLVFGLWFIVETGAWLLTLAWMVARGVSWLRGPAAQRRVERVTAVVLIGFGLRLAAEAR